MNKRIRYLTVAESVTNSNPHQQVKAASLKRRRLDFRRPIVSSESFEITEVGFSGTNQREDLWKWVIIAMRLLRSWNFLMLVTVRCPRARLSPLFCDEGRRRNRYREGESNYMDWKAAVLLAYLKWFGYSGGRWGK
jgi:hypothetical protein